MSVLVEEKGCRHKADVPSLHQPGRERVCSLTPHLWGWGSSSPFSQLLGLIAVRLVPAWQSRARVPWLVLSKA